MNVSSPIKPRRYLIAIGSQHCPMIEKDPLVQVKTDIEIVANLFINEAQGYEPAVTKEYIRLNDTSENIKKALSLWFSSADRKPSDCVILYYAGHGYVQEHSNLHYLLTIESNLEDLPNTAIETSSLIKGLFEGAENRSENILVILDVCFAGKGGNQLMSALSKSEKVIKGSGYWVMPSVSFKDFASDGGFVEALEKVMKDSDWMSSQGEFLNPHDLKDAINKCLDKDLHAHIHVIGGSGSAEFVRNPKFKRPPAILPNANKLSSEYPDMEEAVHGISNEEFHELLSNYSNHVDSDTNRQDINKIAFYAWELIVENSRFAAKLFEDEDLRKKNIWHLLHPLCKIAKKEPLLPDDLDSFFALAVEDEDIIISNYGERGYERLLKMIIRFVLYNTPSLLTTSESQLKIKKLAEIKNWQHFFADLYLRHKCNTIVIPDVLLDLISSIFNDYIEYERYQSIPQVWEFIVDPLKMFSKMNAEKIIASIQKAAIQCKNFIDFKWCVAALHRVIPLFDASESELKLFEQIPKVIKLIPMSVKSNFPQIQAVLLESLLTAFVQTKDSRFIQDYEKEFKLLPTQLFVSYKSHLQLEYACCLYICCQFKYEDILGLSFGNMADNRMILKNEPLFNNEKIKISIEELQKLINNKFQTNNKKSIFDFLLKYIDTLYKQYAQPIIKSNHNNLRKFPALCHVYPILRDRNVPDTILASLKKYIKPEFKRLPSFYALSTQTFTYIPVKGNVDLIHEYIKSSLKADDYSIIRSAKNIAFGLYACYYYPETTKREDIVFLLNKFVDTTGINNKDNSPKFYWAYYAGIKWNERQQEHDFINELFNKKIEKKVEQLNITISDVSQSTKLTSEMWCSISKYSSYSENNDKSIFARLLESNPTNPEIWNIIGTTISNNRKKGDILPLWQAVECYALAKWFASTQKNYDQKYWYNYIRSTAIALKEGNYQPTDSYIINIVVYLRNKRAEFFGYQKDCITDFFELVQQYWNQLQDDTRSELRSKTPNPKYLLGIERIHYALIKEPKLDRLRKYLDDHY
ncbi:caspase family protein [Microcoleus sp. Pol12B5]|uniref:caspase family protein n=1 Tax=Microcoleus sp. Pol12B5 TaxID=3055396 RepID=UPI002FD3FC24